MQRFVLLIFLFLFLASPALSQTTMTFVEGVNGYAGTEDAFVHESFPATNFGSSSVLKADGADGNPAGEVASLIKWDVTSIPAGATVTDVTISLELYNTSVGGYNLFAQNNAWDEATVVWADLSTGPPPLETIFPGPVGIKDIALNATGIALVQSWLNNAANNNGIAIRTAGSNDGIAARSSESSAFRPKLSVTYTTGGGGGDLQARVEQLEAKLATFTALLAGAKRAGNTLILEGMNLKIVNGLGATNGNPDEPRSTAPETTQVNGLGNLIVGYDEATSRPDKTGSHNLIIGPGHNYPSFGGFVAGSRNRIIGAHSTVSGGTDNFASGLASSISGGNSGIASGPWSSISGGALNSALGQSSYVAGGDSNFAWGMLSTIVGGLSNDTNALASSIIGGSRNQTGEHTDMFIGRESSILGGHRNKTSHNNSVVLGGDSNVSTGKFSITP